MATVVASIEDLLARGDIAAAGQALDVAERVFRTARPIQELRSRMDAVKQQQQAGRVSSLLADVRRLADAGELPRAISELLDAMERFPANQSMEAQLLDLRRREAAAVVMDALSAGDMDGADRALRLAEKRFGSDDTLMDLRWRLDALRSDS